MVRKIISAVLVAILIIPAIAIAGCASYAQNVFLPNTSINGIDVSGLDLNRQKKN